MTENFGVTAFPLQWPEGWSRTKYPESSRFRITPDRARRELATEIERMGGSGVVISTNLPLRKDGHPYATARAPEDQGVAVYFKHQGRPMVFACDRWQTIAENLWAIAKTIDALRGIDRWGASDMLERAFTGFQALPPGQSQSAVEEQWWEVLGFRSKPHIEAAARVKQAYRELARKVHPDFGEVPDGSLMMKINAAWEKAQAELRM